MVFVWLRMTRNRSLVAWRVFSCDSRSVYWALTSLPAVVALLTFA